MRTLRARTFAARHFRARTLRGPAGTPPAPSTGWLGLGIGAGRPLRKMYEPYRPPEPEPQPTADDLRAARIARMRRIATALVLLDPF